MQWEYAFGLLKEVSQNMKMYTAQTSSSLVSVCTVVVCGSLAGQASPVSLGCQLNLQWAAEPAQNKYMPPFNQEIIRTSFSFGRHLHNPPLKASSETILIGWSQDLISFLFRSCTPPRGRCGPDSQRSLSNRSNCDNLKVQKHWLSETGVAFDFLNKLQGNRFSPYFNLK